jgi:predicted DNA-binding transcriptional regulator YafY
MNPRQRQLNLVAYLTHHRFGRNRHQIMADLSGYGSGDAGRKMLQRDCKQLSAQGVLITVVPSYGLQEDGNLDYRYRLDRREAFAPALRFSQAETRALSALADRLRNHKGFPLGDAAQNAFERLNEQAELMGDHESLGDLKQLVAEESSSANQALLDPISDALLQKRVLRVNYKTMSSGEVRERELEPSMLLLREGAWYLVAWCRWRKGEREFKLDRILSCAVLKEEVVQRVAHSSAPEKAETTLLRFDSSVAAWARAELDKKAEFETGEDGSLLASLGEVLPYPFFGWLLRWAERVRIVEPISLRTEYEAWLTARLADLGEGEATHG